MTKEDIMDQNTAFQIGVWVGAFVVGALTGLAPLIAGIKKNKTGLAVGGFFACVICGLILGLILALPCCGVFMYLILKKDPEETSNSTHLEVNTHESDNTTNNIQ